MMVLLCLQTADKVSVEELDLPNDGDIAAAAVAAAVLPGGRRLVQDDVLGLPAQRLIKTRSEQIDGQVGVQQFVLMRHVATFTAACFHTRFKKPSGCFPADQYESARIPKSESGALLGHHARCHHQHCLQGQAVHSHVTVAAVDVPACAGAC
jgi:hypothetical protein